MTITARKYYFKPDAESRKLLPDLFRINHNGINDLIRENNELCSDLPNMRLGDADTREAQLELNELAHLEKETYEAVRDEDEPEILRLAKARFAAHKSGDKQKHSELHVAYCTLKENAKKKRAKRMKEFNLEIKDRRQAAYKLVNKANKKDYNSGWKTMFPEFKKEYQERTTQKQKYHLDSYKTISLPKARKDLKSDEGVQFRKFVRGYGTEFPVEDSIVTGQNQGGGSFKKITVAEYRKGICGSSFVKKLNFPDPSAWDTRILKGERKRKQIGEVEISLLGKTIKGTCLFHQALPDDYGITGASLSCYVHSGNTYFYLILTAQLSSEIGKNNFEKLQEDYDNLDIDSIADFTTEEVKEAQTMVGKYKNMLVKKKVDEEIINDADSTLEELRNRTTTIRETQKPSRKKAKK